MDRPTHVFLTPPGLSPECQVQPCIFGPTSVTTWSAFLIFLFPGKRMETLSSLEKGLELAGGVPQLPKALLHADAWDMS